MCLHLIKAVGHTHVRGVWSSRFFLVIFLFVSVVPFVLRLVFVTRGLVPGGGRVAMLFVVASRAELGGGFLVDAGEVSEVQQQRGGEAAESCHVEGQRLAGFQVVQRSVTRRPESWEALIEGSGE